MGAQMTLENLATPRRRAGDDMVSASDLAADEIAVEPGSHSWSYNGTGHEHGPGTGLDQERWTVKCQLCADTMKYEKANSAGPGKISATFELTAEQGLHFRQMLIPLQLSPTEWLRRAVIDAVTAQSPTDPASKRRA